MATGTLTGSTVAARYKSLLKLTGTANDVLGADASAKYIEDGDGTDSALSISTTRVGIGTTSPNSTLHLKSSTEIPGLNGATNGAAATATLSLASDGSVNSDSTIGFGKTVAGTYLPAYIRYATSSATSYSKGYLSFATRDVTTDSAPTERIRIAEDGNVGIGTEGYSPDCKLSIGVISNTNNEGNLEVKATSNDHAISIEEYDGSEAWSLGVSSTGDFGFYDDDSATASVVIQDVTGRVGIAVSAPTAQLHIDQSSASGAVPVLKLDQGDVDDSFIDFIGTTAGDSTRSLSISTATASAKFGAIRVEINGVHKWIRVYDTAV